MKIIGLTGGIGTGKSTVSLYMKSKGCVIIDADKISREMTEKGSEVLSDIKAIFGSQYVKSDGSLDRKALGDLVFNDREKLYQLQRIITEEVARTIRLKIEKMRSDGFEDIVVIDAPLLFECNMGSFADENWLVVSDLSSRISRVKKRDGLTEKQITDRIENQMPEQEKRGKCQYIIDNSGDLESLYVQIDKGLERVRDEIKQR